MNAPRLLAFAALGLGLLAAVAGSPRLRSGDVDVASLARDVEKEEDHVTAIELARWIRDRKDGLRIIDIRDSAEFEDYHVPLAERMSLEDVVERKFEPKETVVLYSGGGAHAAQAWVLLRARGQRDVFFLRGGIAEWMEDVLNPAIPANATQQQKIELDSISALSRYFDGVPRRVDSSVPIQSFKAQVARVRGRGC